jgi:hypothetical protein
MVPGNGQNTPAARTPARENPGRRANREEPSLPTPPRRAMTRNVASALKLARGRSVDLPLANEYAVIKIKIYARPHLPRHKHRQIKTLTSKACRATSKAASQHPDFRSLIINCYVAIRILPTAHQLLSFDRFLIRSLFATYRNAAWFTVLKQMFQGHNSMTNPALARARTNPPVL